MTDKRKRRVVGALRCALVLAVLGPAAAVADEADPPSRVARLADVEGQVSFQPGGTDDWVAPPVNRPLTTGDQLWADRDGRAELQLDGSFLRLAANTGVSFLNLGDHVTQIQLSAGTILVRVRRLDDDETFEIDTPNLAFSVLRPGLYRVTVDDAGRTTAIGVRSGQGEVTGGGAAYPVYAHENDTFSGVDVLEEDRQSYGQEQDEFDAWSANRDSRWDHSISARYVSPDVVGYADLDDQGTWSPVPEYGYVWFPQGVGPGWAPYHDGHWAYIAPWGYTWVDDRPWGFAPFHYGRWICVQGAWGWVPAPPRHDGAVYVRPVYAPALVAWVGVGAGVAWFALGPREVYVPSYRVSPRYVNEVNISNTNVSTTIVNNFYHTSVVNRTVNVTNVNYVNRQVPGAVTATTSQAFMSAQPVGRNRMRVDDHAFASAPVHVFTPSVVPTKQAVLGSGPRALQAPPMDLMRRPVIARVQPPLPPPSFERRQEVIRGNGGEAPSAAQLRQLQPSVSSPVVVPRLAPPVRTLVMPARPVEPDRPPPAAFPANPPPRPVPPPLVVHPNEMPALPQAPSPSAANSVLERQHFQEQQQLHAQQEAERLRIQQQQQLEHAQMAKQQADEARRRELEQQLELQHQQQTQLLLQRHAQEQQQMQERQQEQRRQQESQPAPKARKAEPLPAVKP